MSPPLVDVDAIAVERIGACDSVFCGEYGAWYLTSAVRTIGSNLPNPMTAAWRQEKSTAYPLLDNTPPETCAHESTPSAGLFLSDIAELVIVHLTHDLDTLKAYSLTCRSWYTAVVPHLHHTLTLMGNETDAIRGGLKPLSDLHELGLIPLLKEIRVRQPPDTSPWFAPQAFSHEDLRYFSAFAKVHTLRFQRLEIHRFTPVIERYFGQFSPTLKTLVLSEPSCTPRQLSHFLSLFSNLDNIEIWRFSRGPPDAAVVPDTEFVASPAPKLRGQLMLYDFRWVETWKHLIATCGGLQFRYMNLRTVAACAPVLLEACAKTLETLRFGAHDNPVGEVFRAGVSMISN